MGVRYECGGKKNFRCIMCGKAFSQGSHLKRHLESLVCTKYFFWDTLKSANENTNDDEDEYNDNDVVDLC